MSVEHQFLIKIGVQPEEKDTYELKKNVYFNCNT